MKKKTALEYVEAVLLYLLSSSKKIKLDQIEKLLDTVNVREGIHMLETIAEQLERKGYKKAMKIAAKERMKAIQERIKAEQERIKAEQERIKAEARAELKVKIAEKKKALKTALNMKKNNLDIDLIVKITELDKSHIEKFFRKIGL